MVTRGQKGGSDQSSDQPPVNQNDNNVRQALTDQYLAQLPGRSGDSNQEAPSRPAETRGNLVGKFDMEQIRRDLSWNFYSQLQPAEAGLTKTAAPGLRAEAQQALSQNNPQLAIQKYVDEYKVLSQLPPEQAGRALFTNLNCLGDIALLSGDCPTARNLFTQANQALGKYLQARLSETQPGSPEHQMFKRAQESGNASLQARINAANNYEQALTNPQPAQPSVDINAYQRQVEAWRQQVQQSQFNQVIQLFNQ